MLACSWLMPLMVPGRSIMKMPHAAAASASPFSSPLWARWVATREDEQAVCVLWGGASGVCMESGTRHAMLPGTLHMAAARHVALLKAEVRQTLSHWAPPHLRHGPVSPNVYERRPMRKSMPLPVVRVGPTGTPWLARYCRNSMCITPT